jgi:chemotaxis protein MotB
VSATEVSQAEPQAHGQHQRPVIVHKKHRRHDGHHGGAWKVAYADFVTAMMAFFMVLWLVGQSNEVKNSVAGYFRDPVSFSSGGGAPGILDGGEKIAAPDGLTAANEADALELLRRKGREILETLRGMPELAALAGQIEIELTEEGLRIQLLESQKAGFFGVGSAALSPDGRQVVATIGRLLAPTAYRVVLEGHTDSRPYAGTAGYTNWELSADRANAARRVLEESGVGAGRIDAIRGYADKRLRLRDLPQDPRNRRISIIVPHPLLAGGKGVSVAPEEIERLPPPARPAREEPTGALPAGPAFAPAHRG